MRIRMCLDTRANRNAYPDFPEGQVVTVVDDKIVGCALSIIVDYDMVKGDHTYAKVTGNETFCTHNPEGNILYGIEAFIHPDYRGLRLHAVCMSTGKNYARN